MNLDQKKIARLMHELEQKAEQLERENAPDEAKAQVRNEQISLSRVVFRNSDRLDDVERLVFVSTRFDEDAQRNPKMPDWLTETFGLINEARDKEGRARYRPIVGKADTGGRFLESIQKNMLRSHFFLSVFTADVEDGRGRWPVNPWLVEELAAAFIIPIPVIITIEDRIDLDPGEIGRLYHQDLERIRFSKNNLHKYALDLARALKLAYEHQKDVIESAKRGLAHLLA